MMHGHEKSDPEIVAIRTNADGIHRAKPANNAAPTAAELVERRAGTKGNAGQQSTLRAESIQPCGVHYAANAIASSSFAGRKLG
jgi:RNA-directed DNA polymerase